MRTYAKSCVKAGLASLVLLLPLPATGATKAPSSIEVRLHEFPNGLALYHVRVEEATEFILSATVWVGSVDEDRKTNAGVSHLLEHMLFHQPDMTEVEFKAQVESRGGSSNGMTSREYTHYFVTLPVPHLELGHQWLHKVLFHDRLVTDRLAEEKEIVNRENGWSAPTWLDRIRGVVHPQYLKPPGFWERNFGLPKYDQSPGGTYKVASRLTAAKLDEHYRTYYYPENMVLVYVGPHALGEVMSNLASTFGTARSAGRNANLHPVVDNMSFQPYYSHELPNFFYSEYQVRIGHVLTDVRSSRLPAIRFYQFVLRNLLEERFRYEQGRVYSVSDEFDYHRGAGYVRFKLQASPETYWQQLGEVKEIVWGDLAKHLRQEDYDRYKTTLSEQMMSMRDVYNLHGWIRRSIHRHPVHRPAVEEATISGPWQSLSYEEFLRWVRDWRGQTAPLLELSMPVFPFPHANDVLFVIAIGIGIQLCRSLLRRPFPRDTVKLITRVPYGILGWIQLGLCYLVMVFMYFHLSSAISYCILFFNRIDLLAMMEPYLGEALDGLLIGFALVSAGLIMPRKVLATDRALVLKMRSPLFFRIPLGDVEGVEQVSIWAAWKRILRFKAVPVYPWFWRGLLIHRKSGRPLVLHTTDDVKLREPLSSQAVIDAALTTATADSPTKTEALIGN
jgi:predicted Zn-dependent peptidase